MDKDTRINRMRRRERTKRIAGAVLMIAYSMVVGFVLFTLIPDATLWANDTLRNTGPVIILVLVVLLVISFVVAVPELFLARAFGWEEDIIMGGICAICAGVPVTVELWNNMAANLYDGGFVAFGFILTGGVAVVVTTFVAACQSDRLF